MGIDVCGSKVVNATSWTGASIREQLARLGADVVAADVDALLADAPDEVVLFTTEPEGPEATRVREAGGSVYSETELLQTLGIAGSGSVEVWPRTEVAATECRVEELLPFPLADGVPEDWPEPPAALDSLRRLRGPFTPSLASALLQCPVADVEDAIAAVPAWLHEVPPCCGLRTQDCIVLRGDFLALDDEERDDALAELEPEAAELMRTLIRDRIVAREHSGLDEDDEDTLDDLHDRGWIGDPMEPEPALVVLPVEALRELAEFSPDDADATHRVVLFGDLTIGAWSGAMTVGDDAFRLLLTAAWVDYVASTGEDAEDTIGAAAVEIRDGSQWLPLITVREAIASGRLPPPPAWLDGSDDSAPDDED